MTAGRGLHAGLILLFAGHAATSAAAQDPTFRAVRDAVTVPVSVRDGKRPVQGLLKSAFTVSDNGVAQEVVDAFVNQVPLDVTLILDVSGTGSSYPTGLWVGHRAVPPRAWVTETAQAVVSLLRPEDRLQPMTFATDILDASFPLQLGLTSREAIRDRKARSRMFDAIAASLMRPTDRGRRRLIVVVTHLGADTASVLPAAMVRAVNDRSDAVVHVIALRAGPFRLSWGDTLRFDGHEALLDVLTNRSGGGSHFVPPGVDVRNAIAEAIEMFRTSYIVTYVPAGVSATGWHEIDVSVRGGKYDVRARAGYWRGAGG